MIGEFLRRGACLPFLKTLLVKVIPNSINVFRVKTTFMGENGGDLDFSLCSVKLYQIWNLAI
ncbi:hypothetical protein AB204_11565 [Xenorhabdus khoisanae]|uniref:Uncharacterized protein n=1 Tax=Xenorhabdus khoisanae TaxID=880157 RepID=A0A0J5IP45_9GAMM|nr:hypothetical protein AB204_11565 [Xenorhabdus khoisanae]